MSYDFEFSNAADRIQYPSNTDYTTTVSGSFWLKSESNPGTNQTNYLIKHQSGGAANTNFFFTWTPAGGGDLYIGWNNYPDADYAEWKCDFTPTVGVWTHFYFSIDWTTDPDTVRIWVDNVEKTVTHNYGNNNVAPSTDATQVYSIGGPAAGDPNFTDGKLAEVGIWSDLDPTRVAGLAGGKAPSLYPINLKEYFPLKEGYPNMKGTAGTLAGTPVYSSDHPTIKYHELTPGNIKLSVSADNGISVSGEAL